MTLLFDDIAEGYYAEGSDDDFEYDEESLMRRDKEDEAAYERMRRHYQTEGASEMENDI